MADLLLVDWVAVLDGSTVGQRAAQALASIWAQAADKPDAERQKLQEQLEGRRERLRQELLARAHPVLSALAKQRKAKLVLEKNQVAWADPSVEDITALVIAEVDRAGPLKA